MAKKVNFIEVITLTLIYRCQHDHNKTRVPDCFQQCGPKSVSALDKPESPIQAPIHMTFQNVC